MDVMGRIIPLGASPLMSRNVIFAAGLAGILALTGCGPSFSPVTGVVKLDGAPVEGATVTFVSEDGSKAYSGVTDASGNFTLLSGNKPGGTPGSYKVTVVKIKEVQGVENMTPGGDAYTKMMAGQQKEGEKSSKIAGNKGPAPMSATGAAPGGARAELPTVYSLASSTPLKETVPTNGPVNLDLKSKP